MYGEACRVRERVGLYAIASIAHLPNHTCHPPPPPAAKCVRVQSRPSCNRGPRGAEPQNRTAREPRPGTPLALRRGETTRNGHGRHGPAIVPVRPHAIENSVRVRCVYFLLVGAKKSLVLKKKFSFEKKLSFEGKVQQKSLQVVNGT